MNEVLELKPFEGQTAEIEVFGYLNQVAPKGAKARFLVNNMKEYLAKKKTHVVLFISKGENKANLSLTKPLSEHVVAQFKAGKTQEEIIASIANYPIIITDVGEERVKFLSMPQSSFEGVDLSAVKPATTEAPTMTAFEKLIAW